MTSRILSDEALILKIYPYAETDGIVVCLTRNNGRLRLLCKGWKRVKDFQPGVVSPFNRITMTFRPGEGERLGKIISAGLQRGLSLDGQKLEGFYFLSYMTEILLALELEPNSCDKYFRLFDALTECVLQYGFRREFVLYFQFWILRLEGLLPDPSRCHICGRHFEEGASPAGMDKNLLTVVCQNCLQPGDARPRADLGDILRIFQGFLWNHPSKIIDFKILDSNYAEFTSHYDIKLSEHIGKSFKCLKYLLSA